MRAFFVGGGAGQLSRTVVIGGSNGRRFDVFEDAQMLHFGMAAEKV